MRKVILVLSFVFIWLIGISNSKDSLFISKIEFQTLNDKINKLECEKIELNKEVQRVDGRVSDWYTNLAIGGSFFILLLGGLVAIQWANNKGIAKQEAIKEMSEYKKEANKENDKILTKFKKDTDKHLEDIEEFKFEIDIIKQEAQENLNLIIELRKNTFGEFIQNNKSDNE